MGPVDFVRLMEEALIRLCGEFDVQAGRIPGSPEFGAAGLRTCGPRD